MITTLKKGASKQALACPIVVMTENEVIQNGFDFVLPLWDTAFHKYDFQEHI